MFKLILLKRELNISKTKLKMKSRSIIKKKKVLFK